MKSMVRMAAIACLTGCLWAAQTDNPYGSCSHVSRHGEYEVRVQTYGRMGEIGIGWARSDFDWATMQREPGKWDFTMFDNTVGDAEKGNIQILPILCSPPRFAYPAHEHLEAWSAYVRELVKHYGKRLPVVEVWNEQNIPGFWKNPSAKDYTALLKATYAAVKSVDPEIQVAIGGHAGVPIPFIEEVYKLGGKDAFDIMNVHPYSHPRRPEGNLDRELTALRELMAKYGDADKKVWITEIGWPTHQCRLAAKGIIRAGLAKIQPNKKNWHVLFLDEDGNAEEHGITALLAAELPEGSVLQTCGPDTFNGALLGGLYDVVIYPFSERFPVQTIDAVIDFVRRGGTLVEFGGMPLWTGVRADKAKGDAIPEWKYREMLRIGVEAWWTNKALPETLPVFAAEGVEGIPVPKEGIKAERFLTPHNFKEGDTFIPLLTGKTKEGVAATAAAVMKFNSDMKGAVILSGLFERQMSTSSEARQAKMVPRANLIAFAMGVERLFWYEFQAPESDAFDPESHFGMTHRSHAFKPAAEAYRALIAQRPVGSVQRSDPWRSGDGRFFHPAWTRPDGMAAGAVWTLAEASGCYAVTFDSSKMAFATHLGHPLEAAPLEGSTYLLQLGDSPLYFTGGALKAIKPASADEAAFRTAIPGILSRCAEQYRGLVKRMEGTKDRFPQRWQNGQLVTVEPKGWTSGFFPGSLWLLYEATGDEAFKTEAMRYTGMLEQIRHYSGNHDIGFMLYCSAGNGLRLAQPDGYKEILLDGANALCKRYVPQLGMIRSWENHHNPVIIDNMMNLELLMWASKNGGDKRCEEIALSHADQTDHRHFRPDGSAYHIVDYNPRSGRVYAYEAGQGASADTPWARGQSWGLYGFTMMYRETRKPAYLERAVKLADYLIGHPNMPADKIPYWDYGAAGIPFVPRDASAGAIMASALLELSGFAPAEKAAIYRRTALTQLQALSSSLYFADPDTNGNFLLKHCVGHLPGDSEVDVPLVYADYYFLEALLRAKEG